MKASKLVVLGGLVLAAWFILSLWPHDPIDWTGSFLPAARAFYGPYTTDATQEVCNPPWLYPVLWPIAVWPTALSIGMLYLVSLIAIAVYVKTPGRIVAVIAAAPLWGVLWYGQIDALLLLALVAPAAIGLPFILVKPQGIFLTVLNGRLTYKSLLVTLLVLTASFLIWGGWPAMLQRPAEGLNASLFPYSIPFGVVFLALGLRYKSDALLCLASLCISPYVQYHSMLPAVAAGIRETKGWKYWLPIIIASWAYVLVTRWA